MASAIDKGPFSRGMGRPRQVPRRVLLLWALLVLGAEVQAHARPASVGAQTVCGLYGDVDDNGQINSADALVVLSWTVGLPVPDPGRVAVAGDVNADGLVNSLDALVTLRFAVGLGTPGTRVNQPICTVASVTVTSPAASVPVGGTVQLTATPWDPQGNPLSGIALVWSSSDASRATVSATGLVTGVAAGSATITATAQGVSGSAAITITIPPPPPPGSANVVVDASRTFQAINGWEAVVASGWSYSSQLRDAIVDAAVNDLGLTRLRVDAQASIEGNGLPGKSAGVATNDNGNPSVADPTKFTWTIFDQRVNDWVVPFKQRVEARGEPFVLNITYVGFISTSSFHKNPAEYAEFVSVVLHHLRTKWGLEPELWDVSNEPDNPLVRTGTELGTLMKAAGDRARAEGFNKVRFIGPSVTDADAAVTYLNAMKAVAGAAQYWAEATYHVYRSSQTVANLNGIRAFAQANGLRTAMTELIGADRNTLYTDLTEADVSSWEQFTLAYPTTDNGAQHYIPTGSTFSLGSRSWYLRQYFRYIRPGAVRLGATSSDSAIKPVAFRNRGGDFVVVANTTKGITLNVAGLPAGTYRVTFSTATQPGASSGTVAIAPGQVLAAAIPAAGTITVSR